MIKLRDLSKKYEDLEIFKEVNYDIKENTLTCFLGASGSGKTTLLNLIAGFDKDYKGNIKINDLDISNLTPDELCKYRFNNVGFVFQSYNLLQGYTSIENVLMGIHLKNNISKEEKIKKASSLLTKLGLEKQINQNIESLSGGEKQRVAIARALINDPEIILADEPTGALDSESSKVIMEILKEISKDKTVLIITHDEEVVTYADEVIEVDEYNITVQIVNDKEKLPNTEGIKNKKVKNETPKLSYNTALKLSLKNFKIHLFKFLIAAFIIALGSASFVGAMGSEKIINNEINAFKEKNPLFNKGGVWLVEEENPQDIFDKISSMSEVDNVYYQYYIKNIKIKFGNNVEEIELKHPKDLTNMTMSYGQIPEDGKNEIAITTKLAMDLGVQSKDLIGKTISFETKNGTKELTVSGVINDEKEVDFILSTDVEKNLYKEDEANNTEPIALSFEIKDFDKIVSVTKELNNQGVKVKTSSEAVENMMKSFNDLVKLFKFLSYLILAVGILISIIIMYKIAIERYVEIGLLASLGYTKRNIKQILIKESMYFSACGMVMSIGAIKIIDIIYLKQFGYNLGLNINSYLLLIVLNSLITIGLSYIINMKILKTEPAEALRTY
ncbi:ABC transporter ATP-binding protein/permease [Paraclostridium ghonii]|uniref:ABC-type lipoprotein export system ATPase subunit/ABC-type lipoprotein release transport system permease subunit n=1 Tax=Paraclostridium ghonii TaxID=29358 RepID=A0ABU0MZN6_9FIRM|nr:ATP-binding cassette domain-containing protein [Paeniclostridium ghonii]MDQ0555921.1 ABC-type lipoprotein export system ATPase subunit/ABC-type lipoprotein release transport system permease subunit [Paeniclostridium ghonii]